MGEGNPLGSNARLLTVLVEDKEQRKLFQDFCNKFPDFDYVLVNDLPDPGPTKRGSVTVKCRKLGYYPWDSNKSFAPYDMDNPLSLS